MSIEVGQHLETCGWKAGGRGGLTGPPFDSLAGGDIIIITAAFSFSLRLFLPALLFLSLPLPLPLLHSFLSPPPPLLLLILFLLLLSSFFKLALKAG